MTQGSKFVSDSASASAAAPHDGRLRLPDPIPLPPLGKPLLLGQPGGFSFEDGTRMVAAHIGRAEVLSDQIADGRLVSSPFVSLPSEVCEAAWSPSQARQVAADILAAAQLAEQWESWAPDAPAVGG